MNYLKDLHNPSSSKYLLLIALVLFFTQVLETKPIESEKILKIEKYLEMYEGYSKPKDAHGSSRKDPTATEEFQQAVMHLQKMANLPQTGELDEKTLKVMEKPRCGNPDRYTQTDPDSGRVKRYVTHFDPWEKMHLTYTIKTHSSDIEKTKIEEHFRMAFQIWSTHSPLTFERVEENADIRINFTYGDHGDSFPFPNNKNTIAHAFYPQTPLQGEIHFNDLVTFTNEKDYNLLQLATHEIGHSLGLHHSAVQEAVMVPFYWYRDNFGLHQDDKDGIESLYGPKPTTPKLEPTNPSTTPNIEQTSPSTTTAPSKIPISPAIDKTETTTSKTVEKTTPVETTTPKTVPTTKSPFQHLCSVKKFDAITHTYDGLLYMFVEDMVYVSETLSNGMTSLLTGYPKLISEEFVDAPSNIDAALFLNFKFYLLKGDKFYEYDEDKNHVFPGVIDEDGFYGVPHNIDSAFVYSGNQLVHFTKGNQYYRYDFFYVDRNIFPRSLDEFVGGPYTVDAAVLYNGYTNFVSGRNYYVVDDTDMTIFQKYPKDFFYDFLGCPKQGDNSEKPVIREPNERKGPVPQPKVYDKEKLNRNIQGTKLVYKRSLLPSSSSSNYNYNPILLIIPAVLVHLYIKY